jgi:integrase
MPSIHRQPGRPHWFCAFTNEHGVRCFKSTKTTNRRQAETICAAYAKAAELARRKELTPDRARKVIETVVAEMLESSGTVLPRYTIKEYFDSWLKGREVESSEGTYVRYKGIVDKFLKFLGPKSHNSLQSLTSEEVERFRDELIDTVSTGTVNTYLKVLRVALGKAAKKHLIEKNPASVVDNLDRHDKHERRPFKLAELKKILAVANQDWRNMVLIGLYTGLRLSDIANLTWANLDLQNQELTLSEKKTGATRSIPIAKPLLKQFETLPVSDDPNAPFCHSLVGKTESWLSNQFYDLMTSVGLVPKRDHVSKGKGRDRRRTQSKITFHALRHTATSLLKNAGVSDVVARDIIGHESEAVSRQYTHIDTETKRAALDKMPDVLS